MRQLYTWRPKIKIIIQSENEGKSERIQRHEIYNSIQFIVWSRAVDPLTLQWFYTFINVKVLCVRKNMRDRFFMTSVTGVPFAGGYAREPRAVCAFYTTFLNFHHLSTSFYL